MILYFPHVQIDCIPTLNRLHIKTIRQQYSVNIDSTVKQD